MRWAAARGFRGALLLAVGLASGGGCGGADHAGLAASLDVGASRAALVYGEDDREEAATAGEPWVTLARERAVALGRDVRTDGAGRWVAPALGARDELCRDERFIEQPSAARCSGVLLDGRTVLTAGHCLRDGCAGLEVVRGFALDAAGELGAIVRHRCAAVVVRSSAPDLAVITIEPAIEGLGALVIATASVGAPLVAIGHPLGLPAKVDRGGVVRAVEATSLVAELDLYEGSSGAGVFDRAGRLVAVAARGASDFVLDPDGLCLRSRTASTGGEQLTRADAIAEVEAEARGEAGGCRCSRGGGAADARAVGAVVVLIALAVGRTRARRASPDHRPRPRGADGRVRSGSAGLGTRPGSADRVRQNEGARATGTHSDGACEAQRPA